VNLFRVSAGWRNGDVEVTPGVYELTADEATQIGVDCPGQIEPLPAGEAEKLAKALAEVGVQSASFRPPQDTKQHRRPDGVNVTDMPPRPGGAFMPPAAGAPDPVL
jgi:hypothetical protein